MSGIYLRELLALTDAGVDYLADIAILEKLKTMEKTE
jgi:hypothetical protein